MCSGSGRGGGKGWRAVGEGGVEFMGLPVRGETFEDYGGRKRCRKCLCVHYHWMQESIGFPVTINKTKMECLLFEQVSHGSLNGMHFTIRNLSLPDEWRKKVYQEQLPSIHVHFYWP